jgi:dextranase
MEIIPSKAFFSPTDLVSFSLLGINESFSFILTRIDKVILKGCGAGDHLHLGRLSHGSYNISISFQGNKLSFPFEVLSSVYSAPRYGFLSHFEKKDINFPFEHFFLRSHLYIAQFYDWMYKHEDYIPPKNDFIDPMGKNKSMEAVKSQIESCHKYGIIPFAYGALYGATNEYAKLHPNECFYGSDGKPLLFINRFTIMNFANSPYRKRIIDNYKKAIELGFSGIHVDTYGEPKEAYSSKGKLISFEDEFSPFLEELKNELPRNSPFTFNNVGAWPLMKTATAPTAFSYCEIWDPLSQYDDLLTIAKDFRLINKTNQLVLAAYLKPFYNSNKESSALAAYYLAAVIYSSGSFHLLYGNNKEVLRTGYYPDSGTLSPIEEDIIMRAEDFSTRYGELLFDTSLQDVSFTKAFVENGEYVFNTKIVSPHAKEKSILGVIRENKEKKIISLINFLSQTSVLWNEEKSNPTLTPSFEVKVQVPSKDYEVVSATPEGPEMEPVPSKPIFKDGFFYLSFMAEPFLIWRLIYIKKKNT